MKKIYNILLSLSIALITCFSFAGCTPKENPPSWTEITLKNDNMADYFELNGYLAYEFNNATGNMGDLWADYYYCKGASSVLLTDPLLSQPFYNKTSSKNFTLSNFTFLQNEANKNYLRWKSITFKAKEDIIINSVTFRSYLNNSAYPKCSTEKENIKLNFSTRQYTNESLNLSEELNSYPTNYYTQTFHIQFEEDYSPNDKYHTIELFREYYGENLNEWNQRTIEVKQGQLFCIEFTGIEQITPKYNGSDNYSDFELQTLLNFVIEDFSMVVKVKQ